MDAGKGPDDDSDAAEEAGLKGGVLARRALAVVGVADDDPGDAVVTVPGADGRNRSPLVRDLVLDLVGLAVGVVDGTDEAVLFQESKSGVSDRGKRGGDTKGD